MPKTRRKAPSRLQNRKAFHDYTVLSRLEAGIVLQGTEVKSLRLGQGSLTDSFAEIDGGEVFLKNMTITGYVSSRHFSHEPRRPRKLLLHRKEISRLIGQVQRRGITLVPLALFFNDRGVVKVDLGLCEGKGKADKREAQKAAEWQRERGRLLKNKSLSGD